MIRRVAMYWAIKAIVILIFLGEGLLSWLYMTGRRQQDFRSFQANQIGMWVNGALAIGVAIWL